jgi:hypothetical protein
VHLLERARRWARRPLVQQVALAVVLLAAAGILVAFLADRKAPSTWVAPVYLVHAASVLGLVLCWLAAGNAVVERLRLRVPLYERLTYAWALGTLLFGVVMTLLGFAGLFKPAIAYLVPALLLVFGARPTWKTVARYRRAFRLARGRGRPVARVPLWAAALGGLGVFTLLAGLCTTRGVSFDAHWYHLSLAEHYVADGAIRRFPEGWFFGAYPHLASIIDVWSFLLPGDLADRVLRCLFIEGFFLGGAFVGGVALTQYLVPPPRPAPVTWIVALLFPGLAFYFPTAGADFLASMWAAPLLLAFFRAWRSLSSRDLGLAATMMAGATLTKFSAINLVPLTVAGLILRYLAAWAWRRARTGVSPQWRWSLPAAALVGVGLTAVHWLKNWIWYGSPLYPVAPETLGGQPWTADATSYLHHFWATTELWRPERSWKGVLDTAKVIFTFAFVPHEWGQPVPPARFGTLFSLLLAAVPFVPGWRRLLVVYGAVSVSVVTWFWLHHQDRYLMAPLPWMAAAAAAAMIQVWRKHRFARWLLVPLVALQLPNAVTILASRAREMGVLSTFAAATRAEWRAAQLGTFGAQLALAEQLPPGARLLIHDSHVKFGVGHATVSDESGWQGGLSYRELEDPVLIWRTLRAMNVTHLWASSTSNGWDTLGGDVAFYGFLNLAGTPLRLGLHELSPRPIPAGPPPKVAVLTCADVYPPGLYRVRDLDIIGLGTPPRTPRPALVPLQPKAANLQALLDEAGHVVWAPACNYAADLSASFKRVATRGALELWTRVPPSAK